MKTNSADALPVFNAGRVSGIVVLAEVVNQVISCRSPSSWESKRFGVFRGGVGVLAGMFRMELAA